MTFGHGFGRCNRPFEVVSDLKYIVPTKQVVRTYFFLSFLAKMHHVCDADHSLENCFFVVICCWKSFASQKKQFVIVFCKEI